MQLLKKNRTQFNRIEFTDSNYEVSSWSKFDPEIWLLYASWHRRRLDFYTHLCAAEESRCKLLRADVLCKRCGWNYTVQRRTMHLSLWNLKNHMFVQPVQHTFANVLYCGSTVNFAHLPNLLFTLLKQRQPAIIDLWFYRCTVLFSEQ